MNESVAAAMEYYLNTTPGIPPPPGVTSNFVNPESCAHIPRIVIAISIPIMTICVLMRLYTRLFVTRTFGIDDYLCIVSAACVAAFCGMVLSLLGRPLGVHEWNVPLIKITARFQMHSLIAICIYAISAMFVKVTLLTLYFRLFSPNPNARIAIWLGIVLISVFYIITVILDLVQCIPRKGDEGRWLGEKARTRCGQPSLNISTAQGVVSAVSDVYILLIPLRLVWSLHVTTKRKIGVSVIFLTGLLACICSIISTVYRFKEVSSADFTWESVPVYSLSVAELNAGIICCCMPIIFVLFRNVGNMLLRISVFRYIYSRYNSYYKDRSATNEPDMKGFIPGVEQVAVPKGTLTGLKSFIRKAHKSAGQATQGPETYTELDNMNDEYHAQLAAPFKDGRKDFGVGREWTPNRK